MSEKSWDFAIVGMTSNVVGALDLASSTGHPRERSDGSDQARFHINTVSEASSLRRVIDGACEDAGAHTWEQRWDAAVFICGTDRDTANASVAELGLACVYHNNNCDGQAISKALFQCLLSLSKEDCAAAVLGVVSQGPIIGTGDTLFMAAATEHAARKTTLHTVAIVLRRRDWAEALGDKVYAYVRPVGAEFTGMLETIGSGDIPVDGVTSAIVKAVFGPRIPAVGA